MNRDEAIKILKPLMARGSYVSICMREILPTKYSAAKVEFSLWAGSGVYEAPTLGAAVQKLMHDHPDVYPPTENPADEAAAFIADAQAAAHAQPQRRGHAVSIGIDQGEGGEAA